MRKNVHMTFMTYKSCLILLGVLCFSILYCPTQAQTEARVVIKGQVVDESGSPLAGAAVFGTATTIGTVADNSGKFQLNLPTNVKTISVSYLGYVSKIFQINNSQLLKVVLVEDSNLISSMVVIGYSSQRKETLTGSIAVVDSKTLTQSSNANISNSLVGRVPGIVSTQASGEVGNDAATIRIRGMGTLNAEGLDPLIVVDGVEASSSVMNSLDPNEIESISVLKDASSTAVYGVRGANGVIIVTTKRGESGKPRINFSYRYGLTQAVSLLKPIGSYEYALYRNEAIMADGNIDKYSHLFSDDELWKFRYNRDYTPEEIEMMDISDLDKHKLQRTPGLYYSSHDYVKDQFGELAPQQQYNINVSGGSDRMKYFVSMGYLDQQGLFRNAKYAGANANSDYNRYNIRTNLDVNVFKNTKVSADFGGQFDNNKRVLGTGNDPASDYSRHKAMMVTILGNAPFLGPGVVDGKLVDGYASSPLKSKSGYGYSPMAFLMTQPMLETNTSNFNANVRINHDMDYLTKGLTVCGSVSYNDTYRKGIEIWNNVPLYKLHLNPQNPNEYIFSGGVETPKGVTDNKYNYKWNRLYLEAKINYKRSFGDHNLTGMLLYNAQKTNDPALQYQVPAGLIGMAARVTYGYADRYLAEFNMGYNGSENFPEGKRFGFFPAVSFGWILTNEKFLPNNDFVTWLKIRGSYGEVGNDRIGGRRFLYLPDSWGRLDNKLGNGYYFGSSDGSSRDPYYFGAYENVLGNPDVTWERARKANIGLDVNFFKNRLSFVGDVFLEKRNNILWNLGTIPTIVAASLPPDNIGRVTNKGYEFQVKWSDYAITDFHYAVSFSASYSVNVIDFMDEPNYPHQWMNSTGFALGQYKGYKTSGFYNSVEQAFNRPYFSVDGNNAQQGDFRYVDIDGDGILDLNDQVPLGNSNLPRYSFSSSVDLQYKGFSLSLLFTGALKGSMRMGSEYLLNPFYMSNGAALDFQYNGRWTAEKAANGIAATFPRASLRTLDSQNGEMNDMWLFSTQYIRLKNAEIGYNFSNLGKLHNIGISSIRVFANGSNLFTWGSKLPNGFDPEQQDSGGASAGYLYPPTRTFNMGFNIQF